MTQEGQIGILVEVTLKENSEIPASFYNNNKFFQNQAISK
jgi:hypothetical protein